MTSQARIAADRRGCRLDADQGVCCPDLGVPRAGERDGAAGVIEVCGRAAQAGEVGHAGCAAAAAVSPGGLLAGRRRRPAAVSSPVEASSSVSSSRACAAARGADGLGVAAGRARRLK